MAETKHGLEAVEIFRDLDPADRDRLAERLRTVDVKRGAALVREGATADALYVTLSGRFAVTVAGRDGVVAEIGPGQTIGEIAFLAGGARTATVTALRDSVVLRLDRNEFDELSALSPAIWRSLTVALAQRLAATNRTPTGANSKRARPRTIALIAAGSSEVPAALVASLIDRLSRNRRVAALGYGGGPLDAPPADPDSSDAIRRLNALEDGADYVVLVADARPTPWSQRAIRQADLVLAVGWHAAAAPPNELEAMAARLLPPSAHRLVLVHPARSRIQGTARWLAGRSLAMHHHVALDTPEDTTRLVRFIEGAAVGLVACGGGAYSAAHVGVYKAMRQAGVAIDVLGGTSGGAAMTAAFAMGLSPEEIDRSIHDIFVTNRAFGRYTWPRYSLLDHKHFDRQLAAHYGGIEIEDLWLPYFAVSTNLSRYGTHVHRHGDLWTAVRASGSIPVLLPPFYDADGHMLVDGAILDNLPVRAMHTIKDGPNVVINFEVPELERFAVDYRALPGRRQLAALLAAWLCSAGWRRLPDAPGIAAVLMRSLMANRQEFERHLCETDVLLAPPLPDDMGLLDWHRHTELMQRAFAWSLDALARLDEPRRTMLMSGN